MFLGSLLAMAEPEPCADEWTVVQRGKAKGRKRGTRRQTAHRHSHGGKTAGVPAVQVDASRAALASDSAGEQDIQRAVMQMQRSVETMQSSTVAQHALEMVKKIELPQEF